MMPFGRYVLKGLIFLAVFMFLFGPLILGLWRRFSGRGPKPRARAQAHCPHCGASIPVNAHFCCQCGRDVSYIDV